MRLAVNNSTVQFLLRPHQMAAYQSETRFEVRVWHRRAGKTFFTIGRQLARALQTNRNDHRGYYLAPTRVQAKRIAWDYLRRWVKPLGFEVNESELRVDMPNGSRLQLLGAEQYDDLRGLYADDLALDETADIPSAAWTTVLSPMLADRHGRATFGGTPKGTQNLFYTMWQEAACGDPEWSRSLLTYQDTGILDPKEVERMRRTMSDAEFNQELMCSWTAALRGAYYAGQMEAADQQGRITSVAHDRTLPVTVAVDLGWSDGMACTYWQEAGTEHRMIDADEFHGVSIPDLVQRWRDKPYPIDLVILPHDAKVHELGSGKTRQEVFHSMGCKTAMAPRTGSIHEDIDQVRRMLEHTWFDRERTQYAREALVSYRSTFDEVQGVHSTKPLHSWASHMADSIRYYATGRRPHGGSGWGDNSHLYQGLSI